MRRWDDRGDAGRSKEGEEVRVRIDISSSVGGGNGDCQEPKEGGEVLCW